MKGKSGTQIQFSNGGRADLTDKHLWNGQRLATEQGQRGTEAAGGLHRRKARVWETQFLVEEEDRKGGKLPERQRELRRL
jgi:hypothetical protein